MPTDASVAGVARPNFLVLTPACIAVGVGAAVFDGAVLDGLLLAAVLLGGLAAHISVNALNEYADFRSGLDFNTARTPFSGGSGTLVARPDLAASALWLGIVTALTVALLGVWLVFRVGTGLLPIGLLGMAIVVLYSGPLGRNRYAVLVAPGLGFGTAMVLGSYYVFAASLSATAVFASLVPFFQVSNLLFMNQIPDREPDAAVGRDNFVIAGSHATVAAIYTGFNVAAYATLAVGVVLNVLPTAALLGLLTVPLSVRIIRALRRFDGDLATLTPAMGMNVVVTLATPALVALGLFIA